MPTGGHSKIAIWGNVQLSALNEQGRSLIRSNQSAQQGVIVDHISHFSRSEEQQLPLYRVASGRGFVWIGFSGNNKRGTLRFFAIDTDLINTSPSMYVATQPSPAPNAPSSSGYRGAGVSITPTAQSGAGIGTSPIITGQINTESKTSPSVSSKKKSALIIGNSKYQHVEQLTNPSNDAEDMASTLKFVGFDYVEVHKDLSGEGMRSALREFALRTQNFDVALFFYAGHSIEFNKQNYLIPIDAKLNNAIDVEFEAIHLDRVRTSVSSASKLRMVILDACRNNPFKLSGKSSTRSIGRGLALVEASPNELIAYAAKEGTVASDGAGGRNSPFTAALLGRLRQPGVEVGLMFRQVRDEVLKSTGNRQEPYVYASLSGDPLYLNGPGPADQSAAPSPASDQPPLSNNLHQEASAAWSVSKDTTSIAVLSAFVNRYPGTIFADMATARMRELSSASQTALSTKVGDQCDALAGNPTDQQKNGPGVPYAEIKEQLDLAIRVCSAATSSSPGVLRYKYQLARALQHGDRNRSFELLRELVARRYPAAHDNLGWIYLLDRKERLQAVFTFRAGVELGDIDSMVSLVEMYDRNIAAPTSDKDSKLSLLEQAARFGHPQASRILETEWERIVKSERDSKHAEQMLQLFGTIINNIPRR